MIYLDHNATTFLDPKVRETMLSLLSRQIGNPSSIHRHGQEAKSLLVSARKQVGAFFGVKDSEVIFTSGATEALNMLIQGFSLKGHIISSSLEHVAVLHPLKKLEKRGARVTFLDPEPLQGAITLSQIESAVTDQTRLIVLTAANNETGIRSEVEEIADFAEKKGLFFIVDGVALLGKEPFELPKGVSAAVFSGHKIHGPLGSGLIILRKGFPLDPLILGGPQERGFRGGTENLLSILGLTCALSLCEDVKRFSEEMRRLRLRLEKGLKAQLKAIVIHGETQNRISNTSSIAFLGVEGEVLLMNLDLAGLSLSHGAACSTGGLTPSHVLLHMGLSREEAQSSLRFSLSRFTTEKEIDDCIELVTAAVLSLRAI